MTTQPEPSESILAAGLMIEGKIEGRGHIRVAGRLKGDVNVDGALTVEPGASIRGQVRADRVLVGGEVNGQIVARERVEVRESGALTGDVKADSLIVAGGSKMRGNVEFGWKQGEPHSAVRQGSPTASTPDDRAGAEAAPRPKAPR